MPYITVDIDLNEFDLDDILEEIEYRMTLKSCKNKIDDWMKKYSNVPDIPKASLDDIMKLEAFNTGMHNKTVSQIEEFFKS